MKFDNTEVWGFEHALRGLRNPMNSWDKSDSRYCGMDDNCSHCRLHDSCKMFNSSRPYIIGKNDLKLSQSLILAGSEHRKFMRQIIISVDITAPLYWMAELDTYKIGVTRNSTSMQHKGTNHKYTIDDFETEEQIKEILRNKETEYQPLVYTYETKECRIYTCENGRQYEVYRNGRIFALPFSYIDSIGRKRKFEKREIIPSVTRSGYYELNIGGRNGERWLLHRLVAMIWIKNENNFETIDHLNNNKGDNSIENLEWVTREENIKRQWENFEGYDLKKCYSNWKISSKINPIERLKIKELYKQGKTQKEISELFEIKQAQTSIICRDKNSSSENRELFENCWYWEQLIDNLNILRDKYIETKDYKYFRLIRQLIPSSYLYTSTITMSYENVLNIYRQRKNHKLTEWSVDFIKWVESLPYAKELIMLDDDNKV